MEDKFIQIIPASENLFSKSYIEEDGVYLYSPIVYGTNFRWRYKIL